MTRSINEAQLLVLQWVADGADLDEPPSGTYKTSAVALRSRGLVHLDNRRGIWNIGITEVGRKYLADGPSALEDLRPKPKAPPGRKHMPSAAAHADGSKPAGKRTFKSKRKDETIPMPQDLRNACEAVQVLLEHKDRLTVPAEYHHRVLLLPYAVAEEALRNGWEVIPKRSKLKVKQQDVPQRATPSNVFLFSIDAGDAPVEIRVEQLKDPVKHIPTKRELAQFERGFTARLRKFDHVPGDRMRLEFRYSYHPPLNLDDTKTTRIESKLRRAIEHIHESSVYARERAESDRVRALQRREEARRENRHAKHADTYGNWVTALEQLRKDYVQHRDLAETVVALEHAIEQDVSDTEETKRGRTYVAWAKKHLNESTPLRDFKVPQGELPDVSFDAWRGSRSARPESDFSGSQ